MFKIILIGQAATGKTSIINRFVDSVYNENDTLATIGMDLKSITLQIDETAVRLQIWDTAGQEMFSGLTRQYYRNCQGAIAVFDLTDPASMKALET